MKGVYATVAHHYEEFLMNFPHIDFDWFRKLKRMLACMNDNLFLTNCFFCFFSFAGCELYYGVQYWISLSFCVYLYVVQNALAMQLGVRGKSPPVTWIFFTACNSPVLYIIIIIIKNIQTAVNQACLSNKKTYLFTILLFFYFIQEGATTEQYTRKRNLNKWNIFEKLHDYNVVDLCLSAHAHTDTHLLIAHYCGISHSI